MKKIIDWFKEFPEPYRSQALNNIANPEIYVDSPHRAMFRGFAWGKTPEGYKYWHEFKNSLTITKPV